jgi:hypothetical protein
MQSPVDFLHNYYSDFSTLNLQAITRNFTEPCLSIGSGGIVAAPDRAKLAGALTPFLDALRAKNYGHSKFTDAETTMLNDTAALVRGTAVRYSKTGLEIERAAISYVLHSDGAAWQIAVMILPN